MANDAQVMLELFFAVYFSLIIDRSHQEYRPYDTYSAWKGVSSSHKRLVMAWIILFLLPLFHFALTYMVLGAYMVSLGPDLYGIFNIVMIGFLSFFSFGYYRVFEAFLNGFPRFFYSEEEVKKQQRDGRPEFWAHFMPGFLYIAATALVLLLIIRF